MAERHQLDRIEHELQALKIQSDQQTALLVAILNGERTLSTSLDTVIADLNANTNAVSARLDILIAEVGDAVTPAQTAALQAISDHLKALGQDPANPVPAAPSLAK